MKERKQGIQPNKKVKTQVPHSQTQQDSESYQANSNSQDVEIQEDGQYTSQHSSINLQEYLKNRDNIPSQPSDPQQESPEEQQQEQEEQDQPGNQKTQKKPQQHQKKEEQKQDQIKKGKKQVMEQKRAKKDE